MESSVAFWPEFRAPWGVSVERDWAVFHIVAQGACWMKVRGVREPVELREGDFAVITRGQFHTLGDRLSTPVVNFFDLVRLQAPGKRGALSFGGIGAVTKLVCGGMLVENRRINPLLAILPPLLHVKRADDSTRHWLGFSTRQILSELDNGRTGAKEIVNRLADLLFVIALRSYFEQNIDANASGWLAGVRDPQIGEALAMLHSRPHQNWTVASLARRLAMSRSSFAARFTELVGEPPQQYCTRLRMHAAAVRLRTTTDKLSAVAAVAGYGSESSFVRAFRRHTGMTPGKYRDAGAAS